MGGGSRRGQTLGPSLDDLLLRAAKAHQRGDLATAESACREVLAADVSEPRAVQILGAVLAERGEVEPAVELFVAAAERLGPPSTATYGFYNNYANALRLTERNREAESVLRQLVAVAPREWQPWHNLGQVLKDLQRFDEAVGALRRAVALAPEYGPNHGVLGEVLNKLGRLRSAGASLRKCIDLGWDTDVNLWTILGNNHRMLGELPEAIECLERAFVLGNGSSNAHSNLGIVFAQAGRFDEALAALPHGHRDGARHEPLAQQRGLRTVDRGRDRRGLARVGMGRGARRAPRRRAPDVEVSALDARLGARPRLLLPRAGRRRRAAVRVVLSRLDRDARTTS